MIKWFLYDSFWIELRNWEQSNQQNTVHCYNLNVKDNFWKEFEGEDNVRSWSDILEYPL